MNKFSGKGLAASLCCPAISFLWGMMGSLNALSWGGEFVGKGIFRVSFICAMLTGGILPALLTLRLDIHTEYYLQNRLIIMAVTFVFHAIASRFTLESTMILLALYMTVSAAAFVAEFIKVRDENTTPGEGVILILSDPIVYWTLYWLLLWTIN